MESLPEADFFEISKLSERYDLEFKTAQGRKGRGKLPESFWESYSAMANTQGGVIVLGVKETDEGPEIVGVPDSDHVIQTLFDQANNPQVISFSLLSDRNIQRQKTPQGEVVFVTVPQAGRKSRPVHVGKNPLEGTYRRNNEGDYRCPREAVEQMLGERVRDTQDGTILAGFGMADIELETLRTYRQNFSNRKPNHVLNDLDGQEFLHQLGGYARDRQTRDEGLTLAGLLMFGKLRSILDAVPRYVVDYQERPRAVTEARWIDRLTTDFSWSGNLYDFYRLVFARLTRDLKIPFALEGDQRIDETPVHEALREALVNALIHADFSGNCSILIVKRPDLFGFRNPGLLRVPLREAIQGGTSDCRNRNLQKMFQLVGLGEQSGFGFPKIYRNWASQHWRSPDIEERTETNQTILALRMTSLLPEDSVKHLQGRFRAEFDRLSHPERIALATAHAEGCVTHSRLSELSKEHARDLTDTLHRLVEGGFLHREGKGRGTFYFLPGMHPIETTGAQEVFGLNVVGVKSDYNDEKSDHKAGSSDHKAGSSGHSKPDRMPDRSAGPELDYSDTAWQSLLEETKAIREKARTGSRDEMEHQLIKILTGRFLTLAQIAELLGRQKDGIRNHYLHPMMDAGLIRREHPNIKNHPQQRYTAASPASPE